jgi:hypothetical protein
MQALRSNLSKINDWVQERVPVSLTTHPHPYKPGDVIWVKEWNVQPLKPHWRGPFIVILSIPTSFKVVEITPWVQYSQVKPASLEWECILDAASPCKITLWNTCVLPRKDPVSWKTTGTMNNGTTALL